MMAQDKFFLGPGTLWLDHVPLSDYLVKYKYVRGCSRYVDGAGLAEQQAALLHYQQDSLQHLSKEVIWFLCYFSPTELHLIFLIEQIIQSCPSLKSFYSIPWTFTRLSRGQFEVPKANKLVNGCRYCGCRKIWVSMSEHKMEVPHRCKAWNLIVVSRFWDHYFSGHSSCRFIYWP